MSWISPVETVARQKQPPKLVRGRRVAIVKPEVRNPGRGARYVRWGGRTYRTINECAAAMGISRWALRRKLGLSA